MPPKQKYPWDKWLDGQPHTLLQGVDYHYTPKNFVRFIHTIASRKHLSITAKIRGESVTIERVSRMHDKSRCACGKRYEDHVRVRGMIRCSRYGLEEFRACEPREGLQVSA